MIIPVSLILLPSLFITTPQHCWDFSSSSPLSDNCGTLDLQCKFKSLLEGNPSSLVECAQNGCHFESDSYLTTSFPPGLSATWTFAFWVRDYGDDRSSVVSFVVGWEIKVIGWHEFQQTDTLRLHKPTLEITGLTDAYIRNTWFLFYSFSDGASTESGLGGYAPSLGYLQKQLAQAIDLSIYTTGYYLRIGSRFMNDQPATLLRHGSLYIGTAFKSQAQIDSLIQSVPCPVLLSAPACTDQIFHYDFVGTESKPPALIDSSTNALHITDYNATMQVTLVIVSTESGLKFELADYALISPISVPSLGFSLQFHLKLDTSVTSHIILKGDSSFYILIYTSSGQHNLLVYIPSASATFPITVNNGEWNHYAFSFLKVATSSTYISFYMNGARVGDDTLSVDIAFSSLKIDEYLQGTMQQFHLYPMPLADETFTQYASCKSQFIIDTPLICSEGAFYDAATHSCILCPSLCQTCTSSTSCSTCLINASISSGLCSCDIGFFNQAGSCLSSCPSGFFQNTVSRTCEACTDSNCAKCSTSPSICTRCDTSTRYFLSSSGVCQYCNPTDFLTPNSCTSCSNSVGTALSSTGECVDICGDSIIIDSECDDGNTDSGDGCSSDCKIESGYICDPQCAPIIPLSISSLAISSDFILQVFLSRPAQFSDFTIDSVQLSIDQNYEIFSPELLNSPLNGNYSQFRIKLNPQASISLGSILSLSLTTSSISNNSKYTSIPATLNDETALPSYQFVSPELTQAVSTAGTALDYGTLLLTVGISLGQLLLQSSMEPLWSLINLNQLIFMLPLLSVSLPKNALIAFQILGIANGDMALLQVLYSQSLEPLFSSSSSDPYNSRFQFLGYESESLTQNSGIFLTIQLLMLFMIPVLYLGLKILKCTCFQKCATRTIKNLIWNGILRALIETFLEITICAIVNIRNPSFNSVGDLLSFTLSALLLPIYLILPFKILKLVTSPDIHQTTHAQKYGELYLALKIHKAEPSKFFFVIFCFHRMLFIFSIFALSLSGILQLGLMILATFLFTMYLLYYRPFKSGFDQCSNSFNLLFLTLFYALCLFVHLVSDDFRELGGLLILGSIALINGANFLAIIGVKIWECKNKARDKAKQKELVIMRNKDTKGKELDIHPLETKVFKEMPACLATKRWRVRSMSSRKNLINNEVFKLPPKQLQKTTPRFHWAYEASRAAKRKILEDKTLSFIE